MRRLLVLTLLGCASSGGSGSAGGSSVYPDRVVLVDERGRVYRTPDNGPTVSEAVVPATTPQALQALVGAYEALGLSVTSIDWANGHVGVRILTSPRRIGGKPLATYINCGTNHLGEPRANSYAVSLDVQSVVKPETEGKVAMSSLAQATAKQQGVSSDPLHCTTTTLLETRIHMLAMERLASIK